MTKGKVDRAAQMARLPVRGDEDPYVVAVGGFYRRWLNLVDDLDPMIEAVAKLKGTEDEDWVPVWNEVAQRYEREAEAAQAAGDRPAARAAFLNAKTYYSIARFPSPYWSGSTICPPDMGPLKTRAYEDYLRCFERAAALGEYPPEVVRVSRDGMHATGHLRLPRHASATNKVPAVLPSPKAWLRWWSMRPAPVRRAFRTHPKRSSPGRLRSMHCRPVPRSTAAGSAPSA